MKNLFISLAGFAFGVILCSYYIAFINPNQAYVILVDRERCGIAKLEIEIDNKTIHVEKNMRNTDIEVMFYTGSYPYSYQLTAFTKKCGNIISEIREITEGTAFYERVYKNTIEHEIRA